MKKKYVAAVLAFFMGIWGVHRFYLGQRFRAFLHIGLFGVLMALTIEEDAPYILLSVVPAFIDFVLLLAMPKEEFNEKYNNNSPAYQSQYRSFYKTEPEPRRARRAHRRDAGPSRPPAVNPFKKSGIEKYKDYDYDGAITEFQKSLRIKYNDSAVHFNIACCYSINESVHQCLFHLDKAIKFGFVELDRIHNHQALAFVRTHELFERFVTNGYALMETPSEAQLATPRPPQQVSSEINTEEGEELDLSTLNTEEQVPSQKSLLEQIARLGELRDKGVLTHDEFQEQKQRLLEMS
ncbi:MAG: NINE protein [Bacteroidota bacterium]